MTDTEALSLPAGARVYRTTARSTVFGKLLSAKDVGQGVRLLVDVGGRTVRDTAQGWEALSNIAVDNKRTEE